MDKLQKKIKQNKLRRKGRVRAKISGTTKRPRLSVFRSNKGFYLQLIDDEKGKTLISVNARNQISSAQGRSASGGEVGSRKSDTKDEGKKTDLSFEAGKLLAEKAKKKKIKSAVFDRGGNKYHGRVKAVAEGAREGGLKI